VTATRIERGRDLDHLIAAVIALAGITPST
jgi:hypothetical protein